MTSSVDIEKRCCCLAEMPSYKDAIKQATRAKGIQLTADEGSKQSNS